VVKVKFIGGAACYAFALISLPDFKLYPRRNYSTSRNLSICYIFRCSLICHIFYSDKPVFKNIALTIRLYPRVDEEKKTVIRPDPRFYFFINLDNIRPFCVRLISFRSFMKFSILC